MMLEDEDNSEEQPCVLTSRWVLRDKNGEAQEALVEPRCGYGGVAEANERCMPLEFGSPNSFPCVRVIDFDGQYINLQFDLQSGQLQPCMYGGGGLDDDLRDTVSYLNDKCEGKPYAALVDVGYMEPEFTRARGLLYAEGDVWYVSEDECPGVMINYRYDSLTGNCNVRQEHFLCPYAPVPMWVRDLLPNAPYTLHVEYQ